MELDALIGDDDLLDPVAFRRLAQLCADAFFRAQITPAMTLEWITDGFTVLTGVTPDDVVAGYSLQRLLHPADHRAAEAWFSRLRGGAAGAIELRILRTSGEERWMRIAAEPLRDRRGD